MFGEEFFTMKHDIDKMHGIHYKIYMMGFLVKGKVCVPEKQVQLNTQEGIKLCLLSQSLLGYCNILSHFFSHPNKEEPLIYHTGR